MKRLLFFLLLFLPTAFARAQSAPFVLGETATINSAVLGEPRVLNIYLPEQYGKDVAAALPVIYLLDGSANEDFIHIVGLVQFCNMIGTMPPTIVVGIANVDRKRDFSFPSMVEEDRKKVPTSGGAARFLDFLASELQPWVAQHYRTSGICTIIGYSFGGLLATEILLKHPALFNNYIIISPSLWWDKGSLLAQGPALLKKQKDTERKVFISVGTEGPEMEQAAKDLTLLLNQQKHLQQLKVVFAPLPKESHLTILHQSVFDAFKLKMAE